MKYVDEVEGLDIEALGDYFVKHQLQEKENKTFIQFLGEVKRGRGVDFQGEDDRN